MTAIDCTLTRLKSLHISCFAAAQVTAHSRVPHTSKCGRLDPHSSQTSPCREAVPACQLALCKHAASMHTALLLHTTLSHEQCAPVPGSTAWYVASPMAGADRLTATSCLEKRIGTRQLLVVLRCSSLILLSAAHVHPDSAYSGIAVASRYARAEPAAESPVGHMGGCLASAAHAGCSAGQAHLFVLHSTLCGHCTPSAG